MKSPGIQPALIRRCNRLSDHVGWGRKASEAGRRTVRGMCGKWVNPWGWAVTCPFACGVIEDLFSSAWDRWRFRRAVLLGPVTVADDAVDDEWDATSIGPGLDACGMALVVKDRGKVAAPLEWIFDVWPKDGPRVCDGRLEAPSDIEPLFSRRVRIGSSTSGPTPRNSCAYTQWPWSWWGELYIARSAASAESNVTLIQCFPPWYLLASDFSAVVRAREWTDPGELNVLGMRRSSQGGWRS